MPQDYLGYTIPSYTDTADAVRAFMDLVDDLDGQPSELPPLAGMGGRYLTNNGSVVAWGVLPKSTISTSPPSGGNPGDIWYQVV